MENQVGFTERSEKQSRKGQIKNSVLILSAFITAFFPRFFSYFGAPSIIDFFHFITIPSVFIIVVLTSRITDKKRIVAVWELLAAMAILLACTVASAILNDAGIVNTVLQFVFFVEPFLLLISMIDIPTSGKRLERFQYWLLRFALINLLLALVQSVLIPAGIYPRRGGTIADSITGVFGGGGGSAALRMAR